MQILVLKYTLIFTVMKIIKKKKIHNVLCLCLVYSNHRTEKNMKHTKCHSIKYILDLNWNIYKFQLWEKIQDNTNNINFLSIHVSITYSSSLGHQRIMLIIMKIVICCFY